MTENEQERRRRFEAARRRYETAAAAPAAQAGGAIDLEMLANDEMVIVDASRVPNEAETADLIAGVRSATVITDAPYKLDDIPD